MAILKMKKMSLLLAKQDRLDVLNYLQERGLVVIDDDEEMAIALRTRSLRAEYEDDRVSLSDKTVYADRMAMIRKPIHTGSSVEFSAFALDDLVQSSLQWQGRIISALKNLQEYSQEKKGLFSNKREQSLDDRYMEEETQVSLLEQVERIEELQDQKRSLTQELAQTQTRVKSLEEWKALQFPKELIDGAFQTDKGYFSLEASFEAFANSVEESEVPLVIERFYEREDYIAVLMAWPKYFDPDARALIQTSDKQNFPSNSEAEKAGNFRLAFEDASKRVEEIEIALDAIEVEMKESASQIPALELLHDVIEADIQKLQALLKLNETAYLSIMSSYVPAKDADALAKVLEDKFQAYVLLEDTVEREDEDESSLPPTHLVNKAYAEPIEGTIETFSSPHYFQDIDPSWIMMITYAFFFGSMLSDVGYGLLLTIGCALGIWKFKAEGSMRNMLKVFFAGGICATIFGFLYGSLFGGMLGTLSKGAFDLPVIWFNPMDDPINLMIWSMVFGAVHLFISMGLDIYNKIRQGDWYEAVFSVAPWYLIISGIGLLLVGVDLGKWIAIVGAAVLLLMSSTSKNPFKRIFAGLSSLFGITSWLSDLLSYTRILALTLATSVIAMVVNLMADMIGVSGPQIIFTILVLLAGHGLNLALSTLSAYVHSTRLHYVEFFGKFYTGGGRPYKPLAIEGQYTKVPREKSLVHLTEK